MDNSSEKGFILIISGPSGSGKGTVVKRMFELSDKFSFSVSATSREPRPGEVEGEDYYFITKEKFEQLIDDGAVLEYTQYCGNYYGTPKEPVYRELEKGKNVILEIEVDGAMQIKKKYPDDTILVMLMPPDAKTLEERLRSRQTESDDVIRQRLQRAKEELKFAPEYDYTVFNQNDDVDGTAKAIIGIVDMQQKYSMKRKINIIKDFFEER